MNTIVLVSRNEGKFREIRKLVPDSFKLLTLSDIGCDAEIAETGISFKENALIKAQFVYDKFHYDSLADDSGLEVDALNGAPGVFSARYAGMNATDDANVAKLLDQMVGETNRKARFKTVLALILGGKKYFFDGEVNGSISLEASGSNGFGYDPVFIPDGFEQTFAELTPLIKNRVSHRGKAIQKMLEFLDNG